MAKWSRYAFVVGYTPDVEFHFDGFHENSCNARGTRRVEYPATVYPYVFTVIVRSGVGVITSVALLPVKPLYLLVVLIIVMVTHSHSILGHDVLVNLLLLIRLLAGTLLLGILLALVLLQPLMMRLLVIIVYVAAVLMRRYEYAKCVLTVHAGYTVD